MMSFDLLLSSIKDLNLEQLSQIEAEINQCKEEQIEKIKRNTKIC